MGLKVILTPQSQEDLRQIVSHIALDSQERAVLFGNALIDCAIQVGDFPLFGRMVPEFRDPEVREVFHGSYRIVYEVMEDRGTVYVLRFGMPLGDIPRLLATFSDLLRAQSN